MPKGFAIHILSMCIVLHSLQKKIELEELHTEKGFIHLIFFLFIGILDEHKKKMRNCVYQIIDSYKNLRWLNTLPKLVSSLNVHC